MYTTRRATTWQRVQGTYALFFGWKGSPGKHCCLTSGALGHKKEWEKLYTPLKWVIYDKGGNIGHYSPVPLPCRKYVNRQIVAAFACENTATSLKQILNTSLLGLPKGMCPHLACIRLVTFYYRAKHSHDATHIPLTASTRFHKSLRQWKDSR